MDVSGNKQALSQVALVAHTVHISNTRRTRHDTAPSTHICASSARRHASASLCRAHVLYECAMRRRTCGLHRLEVLGKDEKHLIRSAESGSACSRPTRRCDVGTHAVRPHQHGTCGTRACPVHSPLAASSSAPAARRRVAHEPNEARGIAQEHARSVWRAVWIFSSGLRRHPINPILS